MKNGKMFKLGPQTKLTPLGLYAYLKDEGNSKSLYSMTRYF